MQGWIGNCWFISGVAALAEYPGRMEKLFLNNKNEMSSTGIYGVNIYTLGMPQTIIVDDYLPLEIKTTSMTPYTLKLAMMVLYLAQLLKRRLQSAMETTSISSQVYQVRQLDL